MKTSIIGMFFAYGAVTMAQTVESGSLVVYTSPTTSTLTLNPGETLYNGAIVPVGAVPTTSSGGASSGSGSATSTSTTAAATPDSSSADFEEQAEAANNAQVTCNGADPDPLAPCRSYCGGLQDAHNSTIGSVICNASGAQAQSNNRKLRAFLCTFNYITKTSERITRK